MRTLTPEFPPDSLTQYRKVREIRAQQELLVATLQERSRLSYVRYQEPHVNGPRRTQSGAHGDAQTVCFHTLAPRRQPGNCAFCDGFHWSAGGIRLALPIGVRVSISARGCMDTQGES